MSKEIDRLRQLQRRGALYSTYATQKEQQHAKLAGNIANLELLEEILPAAEQMAKVKKRVESAKRKSDEVSARYSSEVHRLEDGLNKLAKLSEMDSALRPIYDSRLAELIGYVGNQGQIPLEKTQKREKVERKPSPKETLQLPSDTNIDHFFGQLSMRAYNALKRNGIETLGQLSQIRDSDLLRMRQFGNKSFENVRKILQSVSIIEEAETPEKTQKSTAEVSKPKVERHANQEWTMPNGKILMLTPLRLQLITAFEEKGIIGTEELAQITNRSEADIKTVIYLFNKTLKKNKLQIFNTTPVGRSKGGAYEKGKFVLIWIGTEKQEKQILQVPEKRPYEKTAKKDIYRKGEFNIELPNGKHENTQSALVNEIILTTNRGIFNRDALIDELYFGGTNLKNINKLNLGIADVNRIAEKHNLVLGHPTRKELANGIPFVYRWEQIVPELTPDEIVEESVENERLTNYEAALIAHLMSSDETIAEFKEKGIPVKTIEELDFIMELSGISEGNQLKLDQMRQLRENTTRKVKELCDSKEYEKIYDEIANDPNKEGVAELLLYLAELGDKAPEAFEIIVKNLPNLRKMHWTTDRGRVWNVDFVKDGDKYRAPTPTPISRWQHDRDVVSTTVKIPEGKGRTVVETVVKDETGESSVKTLVHDTSAEDKHIQQTLTPAKAKAETTDTPLVPPVLSKETGEPEKYRAILKKDPNALKNMRDVVGQIFTLFANEPTSGQFVHTHHGIKRSRIELAREKGYIKGLQASQGTPRLSYTDAAVLSYLAEHDPKQTLTSREISDVRKMADQIVETTLKRTKRMTKVRGNENH